MEAFEFVDRRELTRYACIKTYLVTWQVTGDALHSGYFYSASSSLLLIRRSRLQHFDQDIFSTS